jgi:hypothetical protein
MCLRRRKLPLIFGLTLLLACAGIGAVHATPLSPFIDLQEKGLTLASDAKGLMGWNGTTSLTVNVGGTVRFALLYWAGRQRPCEESVAGSGNCVLPTPPALYRDQEMKFDGTPVTGTIIGNEYQPVSGGGPIQNVGYFADVTSIVSARGAGSQTFLFQDGNNANNLWRLNGVTLIVAYTNASDANYYRVLISDGLDMAFGPDPTPGDNRVTQMITFNHGANLTNRNADLLLVVGDCTADRPEDFKISNNPTLSNAMASTSGAMWDSPWTPISIPANVGTTTVQGFSEPNNKNPDSLLWEVAALRVLQSDHTKPKCPITSNIAGPPAQVQVTLSDSGTGQTGLGSVVVTKSENADTPVPPFTVGTNDPLVVTATKIDQTKVARVELLVSDLAGNVSTCDPYLALVIRDKQQQAESAAIPNIPRSEDKVTVTNGSPGVATFEVNVNGAKFKVSGLKDGEERMIDISSAMTDGNNVVSFKVTGKPGGSANVLIWDGIGQ